MRIREAGPRAALVEVGDAREAVDLAGWVRDRLVADEVVPGARTVLLDGLRDGWTPDSLRADLHGWAPGGPAATGELVEVPVRYDGPDLAFVADAWGLTPEEVVREHAGTEFVAAFCGFAPGFSYLAGLPPARAVPRLDRPRARLAAGSVGLADTWCGVYPTASPGGWRIIGHTDVRLWDVDRDQPALLAPGARVEFVPT